jgi:hypothetical protein
VAYIMLVELRGTPKRARPEVSQRWVKLPVNVSAVGPPGEACVFDCVLKLPPLFIAISASMPTMKEPKGMLYPMKAPPVARVRLPVLNEKGVSGHPGANPKPQR